MRAQTLQLIEPVSPADHVLGPQGAPVTVVEYGDFECPKCKLHSLFEAVADQIDASPEDGAGA